MTDRSLEAKPKGIEPGNLQRRVFLERIGLHFNALPVSIFAVLINSILIAFLAYDSQNRNALLGWLAATFVVSAYRIVLILLYRRQSEEQRAAASSRWYRALMLGVVLSGLTWGAAGFYLHDTQNTFNQSMLAFVIAGMCSGGIVSLSAFAEASIVFVTLSLLPLFLRLIVEEGYESGILAVMVVIFLIMMIAFARRVTGTVTNGLEMAFLRSDAEKTIERQAMFDELTGLPNRRLLQDRLAQTLARARRKGDQAALLFLDLDFFKRINDSLGHSAGDLLLIEVGRRLRDFLREGDTAARLGGDEFVALLTDIEGSTDHVVSLVKRRGEELLRAIEAPIDLKGNQVHVTVSIGISLLPGDTTDVGDLLKHADTAMYRAKEDGRNTVRFFVPEMQAALSERMKLERELRDALDEGDQLQLYVQPQLTSERTICGAELLLRWERDGSFIPPDQFISIAEDSGLIYRLGDWVVENACAAGAELLPLINGRTFSLAFNVSPRQFRQKAFSEKVLAAIESHSLPRGLMELELTEGLLINDVDDTVSKMRRLRESGVRFSIDDFGTGYSSLRYLKSLPLDTLKVDQSFVRDVLTDPGDASIVRAIISMARTLDLHVIAEGVETEPTHEFLVSAGCRRFQGYLYSRPIPLAKFKQLLVEQERLESV